MLPVFVINLDADAQRLAVMRKQLDSLGLKWERIPAVDGGALSSQVLLQENRRARQRRFSPKEIGCLQSHVTAWRRIAEGHGRAALVLEDDVLLTSDTAKIVNDTTWLVDNDCIVRLETFCMPVVLGPQAGTVHGRGIYGLRSIQHGSAAYIMTQSRAQRLLDDYHNHIDAADHMMFRYPREHHVYQLSPAPCIQYDIYHHRRLGASSTLEAQRRKMKLRSLCDPRTLAHHLKWKLASLASIGLDVARGHSLQVVPYG